MIKPQETSNQLYKQNFKQMETYRYLKNQQLQLKQYNFDLCKALMAKS